MNQIQKRLTVAVILLVFLLVVFAVYSGAKGALGGANYFGLGPGGCNNEEECIAFCVEQPETCLQWCDTHAWLCPDVLRENAEGLKTLQGLNEKK